MRCTRTSIAIAVTLLLGTLGIAGPKRPAPLSGDQLLARATATPGLRSYAVSVKFAVRLHKPLGMRTTAVGAAYFRAPGSSALTITKAGGLAGAFFRGTYKIDVIPQAWPASYGVLSVERGLSGGRAVVVLHALPRTASPDVTAVTFTLASPSLTPIAAEWQYGSAAQTIRITLSNRRTGAYLLPQAATISVNLPKYALDAAATYGAYQLNAPVPDSVFARTH